MIDMRSHLHDSMPEPHVLCTRSARREKYFRGGGVCVLLEEVMLSRPDVVEPDAVGEFHLLERIFQQLMLGLRGPWTRQLMLIKSTYLHPQSLAFLLRKMDSVYQTPTTTEPRLLF